MSARRVSAPTLRRTWTLTSATFVALIIGIGALSIGVTQYQRSMFDSTTSHLDHKMSAVVGLERQLQQVDEPAAGMMYGLGGADAYQGHIAAYDALRTQVTTAFDSAAQVITSEPAATMLADARTSWEALDAGVLSAPGLYSSGAVQEALTTGEDPFRETWGHLTAISDTLTDLRAQFVTDLRDQMATVERVQQAILPIVLGSVLLSLIVGWQAARRITRRVLSPILELRSGAALMRTPGLDTVIVLDDAVLELGDLADTINETATSLRATHAQLHDQAHTDNLTGLANRKQFNEVLRTKLARQDADSVIGALFLDLDDFKTVNDSMGHAAGDELLRIVARRLRAGMRDGELTARLGGDEFAIVLDCGDDPTAAQAMAERVLAAMQEPVAIQNVRINVACSIGVAISSPSDGTDAADELMRNADFAMYTAKRQGKNRIELFTDAARTEARRLELLG